MIKTNQTTLLNYDKVEEVVKMLIEERIKLYREYRKKIEILTDEYNYKAHVLSDRIHNLKQGIKELGGEKNEKRKARSKKTRDKHKSRRK